MQVFSNNLNQLGKPYNEDEENQKPVNAGAFGKAVKDCDPVKIDANESIKEMLKFFMGKNTPTRQEYIIRNLRFEHDLVKDEESQNEEADGPGSAPEKNAVTAKEGVVESAAA